MIELSFLECFQITIFLRYSFVTTSSVFCFLFFFFFEVRSKIGVRIIHGRALYTGKYGMLWFKFILGLMFFGLFSILFAIVSDYGNEYMRKENKN